MNTSESVRRLPAEWEEQSAVQLTFPHPETDWAPVLSSVLPCFVEIALAISRFEPVLIVCQDVQMARNSFSTAIPANIHFVEAPNNDTWARDHGGITVEEQGQPVILDFVFNGWGLKFAANEDNLITGRLFEKGLFLAKYQHGGMVLEGGGIESDGQGTLLTTSECLLSPNRNPHMSRQEIEAALMQRFGVSRILWLEHGYLAGDDTDSHIDTLARFCSPDTIVYVKCTDPSDEHFEALALMEKELQQFRTAEGTPYRLIPLPWPDACYDENGERLPATYANFLIINHAVLVPIYQVPQDSEALSILSKVFPDREVIGIDCSALIWQHGSLHCVTMQYPKGVFRPA
ncbi:MAG: agmatine deiminase family protein [Saprospiraceae bacterium]|nr:agmatine deiminase family protein [Saprospiraceae bacterium]